MSKLPLTIKITCLLLCTVLVLLYWFMPRNFLMPIIIGALLSFLLYPVYKRLVNWKVPAVLSVIITMLLVVILISAVTALVSSQVSTVVNDVAASSGNINAKLAAMQNYLSDNMKMDDATLANYIAIAKDKLMTIGAA